MRNQISKLETDALDQPSPRGTLVDIVVLTHDSALFDSIRSAVGDRHPAWRAPTSEEAVDMLLIGRCGVLLVDMAAVSMQPTSLIEQIHAQFPDVVVVVAGDRNDEPALAGLVGEGLIYRYMHKPLSEKRATMFINAATRHYSDRRGARDFAPLQQLTSRSPDKAERRYWGIAAGVIVAVVVGVAVLTHERTPPMQVLPPTPSAQTAARPVRDAARADPVLSRARAAHDAGRYEAPQGRNALDLYHAVLLAKPDHAEARAGLERTIDAILLAADAAQRSGNVTEAMRLVSRVLAVDPRHEAARALRAGMQPPPMHAPQVPATHDAAQAESPSPAPDADSDRTGVTATRTETAAGVAAVETTTAPHAPAATAQPSRPAITAPAMPHRSVAQTAPATARPATAAVDRAPAPVTARATSPTVVTAKVPVSAANREVAPAKLAVSTKPVPDPLQPKLAMSAPKHSLSRTRVYGAPISSGHAIARVDTRPPVIATARTYDSASPETPAGSANTTRNDASAGSSRPEFVDSSELEQLVATDPVYPAAAMRNRVTGWVTLEFTVTPTGGVRDILVTDSEPNGVFDAPAVRAVSQWRFTPRISNGRAVPIRSAVTLRFDVDH